MSILGEGEIWEIGQIDSAVSCKETGAREKQTGRKHLHVAFDAGLESHIVLYLYCLYSVLLSSALRLQYHNTKRNGSALGGSVKHVTRPDLARRTACPKKKDAR